MNAGPLSNDIRDQVVAALYREAEGIARKAVRRASAAATWEHRWDDFLTAPVTGFAIMGLMLGLAFWITIVGANYFSEILAALFASAEGRLLAFLTALGSPAWLTGPLVLGVWRTVGWVVSVMLPPMAIFFPIFTLLEDLGYLPRVAFNLDYLFKKCGTHGKQALPMCMGFGCNAAGVVACRIIDSPRERLIATVTNNLVPCNGRFPTLILMASLFLSGTLGSLGVALAMLAAVLLGTAMTLLVSYLLSRTWLKGIPSTFALELPPYRPPQLGQVILRSLLDRTLFVLGRAVTVAAPAGLVIYLLANIDAGGLPLLHHVAGWLEPFAKALGLDGMILLAFLLGLPANEIVVPLILMGYLAGGSLIEVESISELRELLVVRHGWTWLTAVNVMLFSLFHFPCGTTLLTILKETKSRKWTALAFLIPTGVGISLCFLLTQGVRLLGLA